MRIFKHRTFRQWAKSEKLQDDLLSKAIREMQDGLYEVSLGSGLYKKRVARDGCGKSGGYRTVLAFKQNDRAIFMYGFAKSERENMTSKEEHVYKKLAKYYLEITNLKLDLLMINGELFEVENETT